MTGSTCLNNIMDYGYTGPKLLFVDATYDPRLVHLVSISCNWFGPAVRAVSEFSPMPFSSNFVSFASIFPRS
jgi:hypothetical protein